MAQRYVDKKSGLPGTLVDGKFVPDVEAQSRFGGPTVTGSPAAAAVSAGEFVDNAGVRMQAAMDTLAGSEFTPAQNQMGEIERQMRPLNDAYPIATAVGQGLSAMAVPGGKLAQTLVGGIEGMMANPSNPILGGSLGAGMSLVFGSAGEKVAQRIRGMGDDAIATLSRMGIPTTMHQRTGSVMDKNIEAGLEAIPGVGSLSRMPLDAQQAALDKGVGDAFGYAGKLTRKGLGEVKNDIQAGFRQVEAAIPDQQLPSSVVDRLDELGVLDDALREQMGGYGMVDGAAMMRIRSVLNDDMADAYLGGRRQEARRLEEALGYMDTRIKQSIGPELSDVWGAAKNKWQFFTAIKKGKATGRDGSVNLGSMSNALETIYPNFRVGRDLPGVGEEFGQMVDALQQLPKGLQSSGTGERSAMAGLMLGGAGAASPASGGASLLLPLSLAMRASGQPGSGYGGAVGRSVLESYLNIAGGDVPAQ